MTVDHGAERILRAIQDRLTADTIAAADASYSSNWVHGQLRTIAPGMRVLTPRGLAGLGWGVSLAIGVKQIGASLGGGTSALQWVVGSYTLMFAALILTAGAFGDRFGARRMYSIGFVVFVAASVACGLAPDMVFLVAARAVQGAGAALLGACSLALLNHAFHDPGERARALGLWAAGASVALSAGPIVGGVLIASVGWRSIVFINVPIGAAGLYLTRRYATETDQ